MNILIIEDSAEDYDVISHTLMDESLGSVRIKHATSAEQALSDFDLKSFDCILLDLQLPAMSGMDFLEHLNEIGGEIPLVIVLTGQGSEQHAVRAMKCGAADYVAKTNLLNACLWMTIQNALTAKEARRESSARSRQAQDAILHQLAQSIRGLAEANNKLTRLEDTSRFFESSPWPMAKFKGQNLELSCANEPMKRLLRCEEKAISAYALGERFREIANRVLTRGVGMELKNFGFRVEASRKEFKSDVIVEPTWGANQIPDGLILMMAKPVT